jgi:hypothetical protein
MSKNPARRANGASKMSLSPAEAPDSDLMDMRPAQLGLHGPMTQIRRDRMRLRQACWAFTTRRVPQGAACTILPPEGRPRPGDLVLARVDALGQHQALQLVNGRRRTLFPGDEVVVAYGHRYASNQFESEVPDTMGPCQLVAGGGIASRALSWHVKVSRGPTQITPVGLLADANGRRVNLRDFALAPVDPPREFRPTPVAVVGTSMDSGKTQTCVHLVRGLIAGGLRVGYAKITGTGAGGDYWALRDAGADPVVDFTDVGMPSTYLLSPEEVDRTLESLVHHLAASGVDAMVLEIADGVLQRETAELLSRPVFARHVGGIVMAAQDSMGAAAGVNWLRDRSTPVLALSGVLTAAPLQIGEAQQATGLPIYDRAGLATADVAMGILGQAQQHLESGLDKMVGAA